MNPEIIKTLEEIFNGLKKIVSLLITSEETPTVTKASKKPKNALVTDIESEVIKPKEVKVKTSDPFKSKRKLHTWTPSEVNTILYCANDSTPKSRRTLNYLQKKLPSELTIIAIRMKLVNLGLRIHKGIICKK